VMSGDTPLSRAHDLSQHLQDKIELLPGVARAFVHVDHETTHRPVEPAPALLLIAADTSCRSIKGQNSDMTNCNI
jgi:hypothetical protein